MAEYISGYCAYCGSNIMVDAQPTEAKANDAATSRCNCTEAKFEQQRGDKLAAAELAIEDLLGDGAKDTVLSEKAVDAVLVLAGEIYDKSLDSVTIKNGITTAKISRASKGLKIERTDTLTDGTEV